MNVLLIKEGDTLETKRTVWTVISRRGSWVVMRGDVKGIGTVNWCVQRVLVTNDVWLTGANIDREYLTLRSGKIYCGPDAGAKAFKEFNEKTNGQI